MHQALKHLKNDRILSQIIDNHSIQEIKPSDNYLLLLIHSIISQQLSIKAADTIYKRFLSLFQGTEIQPDSVLQLSPQELRSIGISNQKSGYIHNVALFAKEGKLEKKVCDSLSDDELITHLSQIKGIGKWTAEMLLIFGMGRLDVFPYDDLGIMQVMMDSYQIPVGKKRELHQKMIEIAENWRPYRSVACLYLWSKKDK